MYQKVTRNKFLFSAMPGYLMSLCMFCITGSLYNKDEAPSGPFIIAVGLFLMFVSTFSFYIFSLHSYFFD
ncbi:MAG: hypothetical protein V4519_01145 [Patescibacteria group bacterium]